MAMFLGPAGMDSGGWLPTLWPEFLIWRRTARRRECPCRSRKVPLGGSKKLVGKSHRGNFADIMLAISMDCNRQSSICFGPISKREVLIANSIRFRNDQESPWPPAAKYNYARHPILRRSLERVRARQLPRRLLRCVAVLLSFSRVLTKPHLDRRVGWRARPLACCSCLQLPWARCQNKKA